MFIIFMNILLKVIKLQKIQVNALNNDENDNLNITNKCCQTIFIHKFLKVNYKVKI